mmetsp:Transcript_28138/g.46029  ORF Transcript_28138/g.46029 Transcript_28138/m.46029 type:complete len:895 (-) Transcript_28138:110-2794(-)
MHAFGLLLVWLACVGHGRRMQNPRSKLSAFSLPIQRSHSVANGNRSLLNMQQLSNSTLDQLDSLGMLFLSLSPPAAFRPCGPGVRFPENSAAPRAGSLSLHVNRKRQFAKAVSVRRNKRAIPAGKMVVASEQLKRTTQKDGHYPTQTMEEMGLRYSEADISEVVGKARWAERMGKRASAAGKKRAGNGRKRAFLEALELRREVLSLALAAEFREEVQEAEERLNHWPLSRLTREGYTLAGLVASEAKHMYMCTPLSCSTDMIVRFANASGSPLPFHQFSTGDLVKVSLDNSERGDSHATPDQDLEGMVVQRTKFYLGVALPEEQVPFIERRNASRWRLDMTANTVTHERRAAAVDALATRGGFLLPPESLEYFSPLQRALAGLTQGKQSPQELASYPPVWAGAKKAKQAPANPRLNKSQRNACRAALSNTLTLWQGPPGTGKTMTICELVRDVVNYTSAAGVEGPKVLATSASNVAVDNILMGLTRYPELRVIRVGAPARVTEHLRNYTLEAAMARTGVAERVSELRRRASNARSDPNKMKRLSKQARDVDRKAALNILQSADVVLATCVGSAQELLDSFRFSMTIVDEATQATEPDVLCALRKGHSAILVGDPAQLPPTVISRTAAQAGLSVSLFERLMSAGVPPVLLDTQYRMHPGLAFFPSTAFYDRRLKSYPKPAERQLSGDFAWPSRAVPAAFIQSDTTEERTPGKGASYLNTGEASAVVDVVEHLLATGAVASLDDVGIVTPYSGQVRLLHERFSDLGFGTSLASDADDDGDRSTSTPEVESDMHSSRFKGTLEIRSVDGYQGREKEVMVMSCVRANEPGNLGFVADARRLNVAITRARRGLVVIGDSQTLNSDPAWKEWLEWLEKQGAFTTLENFVAHTGNADVAPR